MADFEMPLGVKTGNLDIASLLYTQSYWVTVTECKICNKNLILSKHIINSIHYVVYTY